VSRVLPRPAVWAVAQGRDWLPPAADPDVLLAVAAACDGVPGLAAHRCEASGDAGLRVVLGLSPGLGPAAARAAATEVGRRLGQAELVVERVTAVELTLRTA
jgi:hypothetical protein